MKHDDISSVNDWIYPRWRDLPYGAVLWFAPSLQCGHLSDVLEWYRVREFDVQQGSCLV